MVNPQLHNTDEQNILPYYFNAVNHLGKSIKIKIRTIHPDDAEELHDFAKSMARIFATSEPMTIAAGITEDEFFEEIYSYLQFAKKDGTSLILKNEETNKIIGGIIGRDFFYDESEDPYEGIAYKEKFRQVFDVIDISRRAFRDILKDEGKNLEPGLVYRITYLGFLGKYIILNNEEGFGLAAVSFRKFEEYLKSLGYKYLYGEATNPGSQKLVVKSGFTIDEIIIPYKDHPAFKDIDFHKNSVQGIGNSLCGAIHRLNKEFPALQKAEDRKAKMERKLETTTA